MNSEVDSKPTKLFKKEFKETSVKKLILAAVVPNCPENHHNIKQILKSLGMEGLEWGFTIDSKTCWKVSWSTLIWLHIL